MIFINRLIREVQKKEVADRIEHVTAKIAYVADHERGYGDPENMGYSGYSRSKLNNEWQALNNIKKGLDK